jgi:hypothetical protein
MTGLHNISLSNDFNGNGPGKHTQQQIQKERMMMMMTVVMAMMMMITNNLQHVNTMNIMVIKPL